MVPELIASAGGELHALGAMALINGIRSGAFSAETVVRSCLNRIAQVEDKVRAWAFLDPELALQQAQAADRHQASGAPLGPLHGVPVGIKDIIDTADMPTENGTPLHAGRRPPKDAVVVARLRAAGAVIMGKTVTTELATYSPGKTRNPHDQEHTPGGSSSGSAAAVAAGMVPLAVGTQTNGSVIRPAAFCGVVGFKPSYGLINREGVLRQSPALDQIGVFARTPEDAALLAEKLCDAAALPRWFENTGAALPRLPRIAFVKTSIWNRTAFDAREALAGLVSRLGGTVVDAEMPEIAANAWDWQRTVMEAEIAANYDVEWKQGKDRLSESLRSQIERGRSISAVDYQHALERIATVNAAFESLYSNCDVIMTPAVAGTAPRGLDSTGDPAFCTLWTFCGMPSITLPLLRGTNGLPLGVQLVAPRFCDAQLLRAARWLCDAVR
jgi:Asp-tRNA(Asn)/Glu-tRNA(Gln) amidotransferase A subunit family amidase